MNKNEADKNIHVIKSLITTQPFVLWGILVGITLFSTLVLYPDRGRINYDYKIGDVAERDIKAPRDFFIEDKAATLLNKQQVADSFQSIYDYDPNMASQLSDKLDQAFAIPRKFFNTAKLSNKESKTIQSQLQPQSPQPQQNQPTLEPTKSQQVQENPQSSQSQNSLLTQQSNQPLETLVMATLEDFENSLGIAVGEKGYSTLYKYDFADNITGIIKTILTEILRKGVVANKELLLKDEKKGIVLRTIGTSTEKLVDNLKVIYSPDEAQSMVKTIGETLCKGINFNRNLKNLIFDISRQLILPNITMNRSETEKRIADAQSEIKPVLYQIKQGEMILREGERVDETRVAKLKALSSQLEEKNSLMARIGTALMILFSLLVIYLILLKNNKKVNQYHHKNILFLSLMLMIFLSITKISVPLEYTNALNLTLDINSDSIFLVLPLAAGAMTVSLFLGFEIALYFTLALSILGATIFSSRIEVFIFFFLTSVMGAFWMKECRERKIFITTGFKLAFFNAGLATSLSIYSSSSDINITIFAKNIMLAASGGVASGIITAGLTPVIELIFSYTTEIKFLELSNLDQPMMKRLMIEAPGTYNHSVIVANLAEAAASAIGVSPLRTKVGAFYHDIGKLDKPLYFIENQTDGKNRHDKISPSMSALVLVQHTKKGVEFAKEYKLGQEIMDTIQQHHGTSLIKYFYNKSVKIHGADAVKESDFRYPGPKPQTREAAIVMLADVVEAALRTLERPTSARIQGRVQELINSIFLDGQLEECELTLKDLHQISNSFNKILTGLYHHRIEYSDKPIDSKESKKDIDSKKENKPQEIAKESNGTAKDTHTEPSEENQNIKRADNPENPPDSKTFGI
ncbi:MAG: HDIG domain-containing protein [Desulfamplus sp.]|nr:HDIG domain-containing protein [Desulfamplus sp.]